MEKEDKTISYVDSYDIIRDWFQGEDELNLNLKDVHKIVQIPKVKVVKMNGNSIKNIINLPDKIDQLEITANMLFKIENLPKETTSLNLSTNNISVLENIPESVVDLNLSKNKIEKVETLSDNILRLDLSRSSISQVLYLPNKLLSLNLENNKVKEIVPFPDTLEYLNLSGNDLVVIPVVPLSLKQLRLANNRITKILNIAKIEGLDLLDLSINAIKQLEKLPPNLETLNMETNKISILENLPESLNCINLSENNISNMDYPFSDNLITLKLDVNRLNVYKKLPKNLTTLSLHSNFFKTIELTDNIVELDLTNNNLSEIPKLPKKIKSLNLSNNRIKKIDSFEEYEELVFLKLEKLQLKRMVPVPNTVTFLSYKDNKIKKIKYIPKNVEYLDVSYNSIQELPIILLEYRNLATFIHYNNQLEIVPYIVSRWLDQMNNRGLNANNEVYQDGQNVHNSTVQSSFRYSLNNLLKDEKVLSFETVIDQIKKTKFISDFNKDLVDQYCKELSRHGVYLITYQELLCNVWSRIQKNKNRDDLIKIYNDELDDGFQMCFTGRLTRLLNVLAGYYEDIEIQIGDNEQISNIIISLQKKYEGIELKKFVIKELEERDYPRSVIDQWLEYL